MPRVRRQIRGRKYAAEKEKKNVTYNTGLLFACSDELVQLHGLTDTHTRGGLLFFLSEDYYFRTHLLTRDLSQFPLLLVRDGR